MSSNYPDLRPGLTVAIPTFNRPGELARTLEVIIPQILRNGNVYLDVYDNCSPEVPACFSDPRLLDHPRVRLVRNRYNVGFANFMKCVEHCQTEWLWVLGDDDLPAGNAVEIILSKLAPEYAYMTFGIPSAKTLVNLPADVSGEGLQAYFDQFDHRFMQMVCLSASIYQIRLIRDFISIGYTNIHSAVPQTLMPFLAIEQGAKWLCSKDCIADYKIPDETQHWNRFSVFAGLPTVLLPLKLAASRTLVRKAIRGSVSPKPEKFLPHLTQYLGKNDGDIGEIFAGIRASYSPSFTENRKRAWRWLKMELRLRYPKLPFLGKN
jgi:glycosyltransferase involved in cell wall biosynthesis